MKKTKLAGDNISLKTRKTEEPLVMAWLNAQTNLMDSFRYLVENEILQHGVRNLQMFIPVERAGVQSSPAPSHAAIAMEEAKTSTSEAARAVQAVVAAQAEMAVAADAGVVHGEELAAAHEAPMIDEVDDEDIEAWS
ncbi:hypothetical protein [Paenibacillus albus]|uniref:Uncharacterized protein n=1 Tax=Paenibacillus albus TaxID=2495582 RepID=A0A3Q8X298_9BACL|nr:hypothetical protein [Paenibacillus albus]AZN38799.1 hypothetical protein EJC50_03245 [Paenibacillus albus]